MVLDPTLVRAQEKHGAVLLQPESDMDQELADDLTEVLISSVIDKSNRLYRMEGKESFKKILGDKKAPDGGPCINAVECVRATGKEMALDLLVFGKVGKAMGGFRLEVHKLSMTAAPDRTPLRKRVEGEVDKLIEEVDALAVWVLEPDNVQLTIEITPSDAELLLDDKPVKPEGKPVEVAPGNHVLKASKPTFETATLNVNCAAEAPCKAVLVLKPLPKGDGGKTEPVKTTKKKKGGRIKPSTIAGVVILGALAAGTGAVWGVMYGKINSTEDEILAYVDKHCPNNNCDVTRDQFDAKVDPLVKQGELYSTLSWVFGATTIATGAAALTWLIVDAATPEKKSKSGKVKTSFLPQVGPSYSGVSLGITF
jgi:hypothetical protein